MTHNPCEACQAIIDLAKQQGRKEALDEFLNLIHEVDADGLGFVDTDTLEALYLELNGV